MTAKKRPIGKFAGYTRPLEQGKLDHFKRIEKLTHAELKKIHAALQGNWQQVQDVFAREAYRRQRKFCSKCRKMIRRNDLKAMSWRILSKGFAREHLVCGKCGEPK